MTTEILCLVILPASVLLAYVIGIQKGIEMGMETDNSFEDVARRSVKAASEALELVEKLQKENDLLKQQLSQKQKQDQ